MLVSLLGIIHISKQIQQQIERRTKLQRRLNFENSPDSERLNVVLCQVLKECFCIICQWHLSQLNSSPLCNQGKSSQDVANAASFISVFITNIKELLPRVTWRHELVTIKWNKMGSVLGSSYYFGMINFNLCSIMRKPWFQVELVLMNDSVLV